MAKFAGDAEPLTRQGFAAVVEEVGVGAPKVVALLARWSQEPAASCQTGGP